MDLPELAGRFTLPVQTIVYRLVQEALTNIGKHAEPTQVRISAREENRQLLLVIEDDGQGFDMTEVRTRPQPGPGPGGHEGAAVYHRWVFGHLEPGKERGRS